MPKDLAAYSDYLDPEAAMKAGCPPSPAPLNIRPFTASLLLMQTGMTEKKARELI
jgi:hypothetical protein